MQLLIITILFFDQILKKINALHVLLIRARMGLKPKNNLRFYNCANQVSAANRLRRFAVWLQTNIY